MTLPCLTCGDDIRLTSLSPVTWGHVAIRRNGDKHPARPPRMRTDPESSWNVRLARDGQASGTRTLGNPAHREGPAASRAVPASVYSGEPQGAVGPSPDPALAPVRAARARASMPDHSSSSPAGKARRTGAAPRPTAPRLPRSAGTL